MSDETTPAPEVSAPAKTKTLLQQQVKSHTDTLKQALERKKQLEAALEEVKVQINMLQGAIMSLNQLEEATRAAINGKTDVTPGS